MRKPLYKYLIDACKEWNKERKRTSWLYCPVCKHDLNGDNDSFDKDEGGYWYFTCDRCGCKSQWSFHMLPFAYKWQHLKKKLEKEL